MNISNENKINNENDNNNQSKEQNEDNISYIKTTEIRYRDYLPENEKILYE